MSYPALFTTPGVRQFAEGVDAERARQLAKFGDQQHPDGTGGETFKQAADVARAACQLAATRGDVTWQHILSEEFFEALAETDPANLRTELMQLAALCQAWIYDIDQRPAAATASDKKYPARLGVYCDNCGTEFLGDFVVADSDTKGRRLAIVREHVRTQLGWSVGPAGDFCPACCTITATPTA